MTPPILVIISDRKGWELPCVDVIRAAAPSRLYVAVICTPENGATNAPCEKARAAAAAVDRPFELRTIVRVGSFGERFALVNAVNWFFQNEPEGIVLQCDCVPAPDFFSFCAWALAAYRDEKRVWHLNGRNLDAPTRLFGDHSVGFSSLAQAYGWASWRDRWQHYVGNVFDLARQATDLAPRWRISTVARDNMLTELDRLKGDADGWFAQWQMTILNHGGLCIVPRVELAAPVPISAVNNVAEASAGVTEEFSPQLSFRPPRFDPAITSWFETQMGLANWQSAAIGRLGRSRRKMLTFRDERLSRILFRNAERVVVASTGRNGSTMLHNALAEGFVRHSFGRLADTLIGRELARLSKRFVDRLVDVPKFPEPIQKTHDLYDDAAPASAKYIFVYGDPLEAAQSVESMVAVRGEIWLERHLYHLRSSGLLSELYRRDILNYEKQLGCWMGQERYNVLPVHYEDLWRRTDEIAEFVGFPLSLPARSMRTPKPEPKLIDEALFERLREVQERYSQMLLSRNGDNDLSSDDPG